MWFLYSGIPHDHRRPDRGTAIDTTEALRVPDVRAVFTHRDAPERRYSTARHEHPQEDPDDTRVFDDVVRYVGQRVAAVVGESEGAAERGCRAIRVRYETLPYVLDPEEAMRPGAPVVHDKDATARQVVGEVHGEVGEAARGFAEAARSAPQEPSSRARRPWPPRAPSPPGYPPWPPPISVWPGRIACCTPTRSYSVNAGSR